jgi:RAQPRD family integrative conjugative element protein
MKGILPTSIASIILVGAVMLMSLSGNAVADAYPVPLDETFADADMERQYLSMLVNEIEGLDHLIKKAKLAVDKDERVRFQYQWLERDLAVMKEGIENHINAPRTAPRTVEALSGDYRK